jgi:uncharacterized protein YhfF
VTARIDLADLTSFKFGDSPALADRLASLVVAGVKTATCYPALTGPQSKARELQVVLNGLGQPVAVIEILSLDTLPIDGVTPAQSALEGEGDLSHAYWLAAHKSCFTRDGSYTPGMLIIFETFRLVEKLDAGFAERAAGHLESERAEARAAGYVALGADQ